MICSALFWENEAVYNPECSPGKQQFQPESSPQTHWLFIAASADNFSTVTDSFLVYKMSENSKKKKMSIIVSQNLMWWFYMSCFIWPAVQNQKIQFNMIWTPEKQKHLHIWQAESSIFSHIYTKYYYRFKNDQSSFLSVYWVIGWLINAALIKCTMCGVHSLTLFIDGDLLTYGENLSHRIWSDSLVVFWSVCVHLDTEWFPSVSPPFSDCFCSVTPALRLQLGLFPCSTWPSSQNVLERIQPLTLCTKWAPELSWAELRLNRGRGAYSLLTN